MLWLTYPNALGRTKPKAKAEDPVQALPLGGRHPSNWIILSAVSWAARQQEAVSETEGTGLHQDVQTGLHLAFQLMTQTLGHLVTSKDFSCFISCPYPHLTPHLPSRSSPWVCITSFALHWILSFPWAVWQKVSLFLCFLFEVCHSTFQGPISLLKCPPLSHLSVKSEYFPFWP